MWSKKATCGRAGSPSRKAGSTLIRRCRATPVGIAKRRRICPRGRPRQHRPRASASARWRMSPTPPHGWRQPVSTRIIARTGPAIRWSNTQAGSAASPDGAAPSVMPRDDRGAIRRRPDIPLPVAARRRLSDPPQRAARRHASDNRHCHRLVCPAGPARRAPARQIAPARRRADQLGADREEDRGDPRRGRTGYHYRRRRYRYGAATRPCRRHDQQHRRDAGARPGRPRDCSRQCDLRSAWAELSGRARRVLAEAAITRCATLRRVSPACWRRAP